MIRSPIKIVNDDYEDSSLWSMMIMIMMMIALLDISTLLKNIDIDIDIVIDD